jgi:15-cis-phytoene desaturase
MSRTVAVLGGGIGGLTAAHELAQRGFQVTVYERKPVFGGKARSLVKLNTGVAPRADLPGEHGFRFFPGFYKHVIDTMKRIPFREGSTVYDNLAVATRILLARMGAAQTLWVARVPQDIGDFRVFLGELFTNLDIPQEEVLYFVERLLVVATSCPARRQEEYEKISYWDFIGASERSQAYQHYLGQGLTRSLVAMRAQTSSTRTVAPILLQLFYGLMDPDSVFDRLLTGPTNDVWIVPWVTHLKQLGVQFRAETSVTTFRLENGRISGVDISTPAGPERVVADYYVAAMPVEVMRGLVSPEMAAAAPSIANLNKLQVEWMNGIQFYLDRDEPLAHGHVLYLDSPWALTSISQHQFWRFDLATCGDGRCRGILSVDISDWETAGHNGKLARECTPDEVRHEVWEQLRRHIDVTGQHTLDDTQVIDWFLDPDIEYPNPSQATNLEPLLINTVDSYQYRPNASTELPNLFLASDYVRTYTDIATMEAANEAARRAANAILAADGGTGDPASLWPLEDPDFLRPLQEVDALRYAVQKKHLWHDAFDLAAKWTRLTH